MKLLIKNGQLIDGKGQAGYASDVLIEDGIVQRIAANISEDVLEPTDRLIDTKGKLVVPGLIDIHVHLREPGQEDKETIYSGTRSAAAGGFTAVACMPNTNPIIDNKATAEMVNSIAKREGAAKVYVIAAITKGSKGDELTEYGDLKEAGVVALSDDGRDVQRSDVMRNALEYSKAFDLPIICHCEDEFLTGNGVVNEGYWSVVTGLPGVPNLAEDAMTWRNIQLAKLTNGKVHIAHVSTAGSVEIIRQAKKEGLDVTAEVAPHHLILTDEAIKDYDTNTKMYPPLRTQKDVDALIEGLKDGTIDLISTDHAPHTFDDKNKEYAYASYGIVGLETALGLVVKSLVEPGHLSWEQVVEKMSTNPAKCINVPGGTIEEGKPADIAVIDPDLNWTVDVNEFYSMGRNTPFKGWQLRGKAVATILDGKLVMQNGQILL